jgi:hypothetical protein
VVEAREGPRATGLTGMAPKTIKHSSGNQPVGQQPTGLHHALGSCWIDAELCSMPHESNARCTGDAGAASVACAGCPPGSCKSYFVINDTSGSAPVP